MEVTLNINNSKYNVLINSNDYLYDTLRKIGFKSLKKGCDTTSCGMCSVSIDDKLIPSCSYHTIRAVGKNIITVEGIKDEASVIADYLTEEGVEQCGFCSPGLVMAVFTMKKELVDPSLEDVKHYLAGNMCRCSGYEGQHRAIMKYLEVK